MTVIAVKGKTMAADGLVTVYNTIVSSSYTKLLKHGGCIYGFAGGIREMEVAKNFIQGLLDETFNLDLRNLDVLKLHPDGTVEALEYMNDVGFVVIPLESPTAIGSGADSAIGALMAGASAQKAVKIACSVNTHCGGDIQVISL